jgi:hypothetical protein
MEPNRISKIFQSLGDAGGKDKQEDWVKLMTVLGFGVG